MEAVLVPSESCPSDPNEIAFSPSVEGQLPAEKVHLELAADAIKVVVDRRSSLLTQSGGAQLCLVDTDCNISKGRQCVSTFGSATWSGPLEDTRVDVTCTKLRAGNCEVTIPGLKMTSVNYNVPRVAIKSVVSRHRPKRPCKPSSAGAYVS